MFDLQLGALKLFTQLNGPRIVKYGPNIVKSWGRKDLFLCESNIVQLLRLIS